MKTRLEPRIREDVLTKECKIDQENLDKAYYQNIVVNESFESSSFNECKFEKVTFTNAINKVLFLDCIFDHCDFSNLDCQENVFRRVVFKQCRFTGTDLSECTFQDVLFEDCEASYLNVSSSKWTDSQLVRTRFLEGYFNMVKHKNLMIQECNFVSTEWLNTKLGDINFCDSIIDGMIVNAENLKGVTVNPNQAIELAKLLGIIVR